MSHANRGKTLEDLLEARAEWRRDAYVIRLGPPGFYSRIGKRLVWTVTGVMPPDYLAIWEGRAFVADAKSTVEERWEFRLLEKHQAEALDRVRVCRGIAGLIVQIRAPQGPIYWVPWGAIRLAWWQWKAGHAKRGEASVGEEWLQAHGRRVVDADWVAAAAEGGGE